MPWQRAVFDVASEVDDAGHLYYRTVVLVVPRQQGKSTATNAVMVDRAAALADANVVYTAQDRAIAVERIIEQLYRRQLARSPLGRRVTMRQTNGSERLTLWNGSRIMVAAPTETAAHGFTLDLGMIDEAWAQRTMALPQAYSPAMLTRPDAQLWVVSTVGDGTDALLAHYQAVGAASLTDPDTRVAYFEWSAHDADDPDDPAVWAACMPALGHTCTVDTIRAERQTMKPAEFERAYLCRRPRLGADGWGIDEASWVAARDTAAAPGSPLVFAVEVPFDRSTASIVAAGPAADGRLCVEVVDRRPGTGWVLDWLVDRYPRHYPAAIAVDTGGPAGSLYAELVAHRLPVVTPTARELAAACGAFHDAVVNGRLCHRGDVELDEAVAGATRRPLSNAWAWERRTATVDVSPLVAATLAAWAWGNLPPAPSIVTRP